MSKEFAEGQILPTGTLVIESHPTGHPIPIAFHVYVDDPRRSVAVLEYEQVKQVLTKFEEMRDARNSFLKKKLQE